MFSAGGFIMVMGIVFSLLFIGGSIYAVTKLFGSGTQDILVKFIVLVFTSLVALFIVDKVVAFKIKLVNDEQNAQLFELIKTLVLMVFSYYFGTKSTDKVENKKE